MKLVDPQKLWFVLRSKVRQEERAEKHIREAGFDVYLPRMKEERQDRRTHVYSTIEKPAFVGYLFVGFTSFACHFEKVRKCDGVYEFIKVQGEPISIPSRAVVDIQVAEMDMRFDKTRAAQIHRGEIEKTKKLETKKQFPKGLNVHTSEGPFANLMMVVEEVTKSGNVTVLVDMFGQAVRAEFNAGQLKPAA